MKASDATQKYSITQYNGKKVNYTINRLSVFDPIIIATRDSALHREQEENSYVIFRMALQNFIRSRATANYCFNI